MFDFNRVKVCSNLIVSTYVPITYRGWFRYDLNDKIGTVNLQIKQVIVKPQNNG